MFKWLAKRDNVKVNKNDNVKSYLFNLNQVSKLIKQIHQHEIQVPHAIYPLKPIEIVQKLHIEVRVLEDNHVPKKCQKVSMYFKS